MARGGARINAGRKKGVPNGKTQKLREEIEKTGLTPLQYLTEQYQNESNDADVRLDAAKAAAPYIHARLSAVQMDANIHFTHEDALALLDD
ncbi:hypothetical protein MNBD_ALPHA03-1265 [hydrothermal vent metagenome]|uniref:Uncharacterized protein n=1 Tax=hydrothermal vent metagenome TaxID=652676 RepID=A0A3B1BC31_9ZZZZ